MRSTQSFSESDAMTAEIINLRRARKVKARAEREVEAEANRRLFGRSRDERKKEAAERAAAERRIEGHRCEPDES
jgi:hypothetical protein